MPARNVSYSVQQAEATTFGDRTFDAVCVAQALHWFDIDRFFAEARRVLKPRGVILVTGYGWSGVSRRFDHALFESVIKPIQPLWPSQNKLLIDGYRDVPFPFERIEMPRMSIEMRWTFGQMLDYIGTWTAMRSMIEIDPAFLVRCTADLQRAWGGDEAKLVTMPLVVLCGRHA